LAFKSFDLNRTRLMLLQKCVEHTQLDIIFFIAMTEESHIYFYLYFLRRKFKDAKGVIRICKSKNRQHNGQNKIDKGTTWYTKQNTEQ
jgi:hypothetical protein